MPELVALGRVVRAQGLKGELRILPYGLSPTLCDKLVGKTIFLRPPQGDGQVRRTTLHRQRPWRGLWIVALDTCTDRQTAESLVGWEICLAEDDLPRLGEDEYYEIHLIGLKVINASSGEQIGEVCALRPSPGSDLLEVQRPSGGRFLIPAVKALITKVDLESRTIEVDLPEGLTELEAE